MSPTLERRDGEKTKAFWKPKEVAELLGVHYSTVIRMFQDEPGVLKLNQKSALRRRPHVTLRIPNALLQRKLRELAE